MSDRTYETDLQVFINLVQQGEAAIWAQAAWAMEMTGRHGRGTAKMLAADVGLSASYVRQMVATAKAFPTPESRGQDLTFTHHRLAAMTGDPEKWLDAAAEKGYSIAELRRAINDAKDQVSLEEQARRATERLFQAVNKYNELYAPVSGERASIVWDKLQAKSA
ncbi:MAG: hypothetical protein M0Z66_03055 [Thermaerobacter sp.]|nr:hypothetical protein [Thermaerobacter sp.]